MGQPVNLEVLDQAVELANDLHAQVTANSELLNAQKTQIEQDKEQFDTQLSELAEKLLTEQDDTSAEAERMRRAQLVADAVADGRKLVTVRTIDAIDDIPGADLIKVATVEGWKVVVKAGEFKPGDPCVFFEVDSYLPMDDERFKFLEKNAINWEGIPGARLKTIRLRGQISQGLALPLSLFFTLIEKDGKKYITGVV